MSTSPGWRPEEITAVADVRVELCESVTASLGSTAMGAPPWTYVTVLPPFPSASGAAGAVTTSTCVEVVLPTVAVTVGFPGCVSSM